MKKTKEYDERPNKAQFDSDADHKIRNNSNNSFTPFKLTKKDKMIEYFGWHITHVLIGVCVELMMSIDHHDYSIFYWFY